MPNINQQVEGFLMQCLSALAMASESVAVQKRCEELLALWSEEGDFPAHTGELPPAAELPPWSR